MAENAYIHWWKRRYLVNRDKVQKKDFLRLDGHFFATNFFEDCLRLCEQTWDRQKYLLKLISSQDTDVLPRHCRDDEEICQKLESMAKKLADELNWSLDEEYRYQWKKLLQERGYYNWYDEADQPLFDCDHEMSDMQNDIINGLWWDVDLSEALAQKWAEISPSERQSLGDEELRVSLILLGFICGFYNSPHYTDHILALREELVELQTMSRVLKRLDLSRKEVAGIFDAFQLLESVAGERKREMRENNQRSQKARESAKRKRHILKLSLMVGVHEYLKISTPTKKTQRNRELQERFLGYSSEHPVDDAGRRLWRQYCLWSQIISELKNTDFDAIDFFNREKIDMDKKTFLDAVNVIQEEHLPELEKSGKLIEF